MLSDLRGKLLSVEIVGDLPGALRADLELFATAAERHSWGGSVAEARLVVAPNGGSIDATVRPALRRWMPAEAFAEWEAQQHGRPVATGGKTFVAADGVVTAVVMPIGDRAMFLGIATHEVLECAHLVDQIAEGFDHPSDPREANGVVLADEYVTDRARIEIVAALGWPESVLDEKVGIIEQLGDLKAVLGRAPVEGQPTHDFWLHWVNLARVWAMLSGRADAGAASARAQLEAWERQDLVDARRWKQVRASLQGLYTDPGRPRAEFAAAAASQVWDPIEALGREAWAGS